jgi:arylsulfatase A-like enzyme
MKKLLLALCLLPVVSARPVAAEEGRPNILFCLADDWGWPHAGAYGDKVVKTPTFDRLAREGVLFEHAFISSPSCTPCRNSIVTGQQFYRLGQGANLWSTLDVRHPNFMYLLREAGYQIGHWRKAWGPGDARRGGYKESPMGPQGKFTDFMRKRDKSKPFCFWFGTSDPHRGYRKGSGRKSGIPVDKVRVPAFYPANAAVRGDIADYYFEVQRWDRDVGAAMKLLEAEGALENTIIAMSGDHGMPFPRCKGNLYDWGARVPLAVRWGAKVRAGRTLTDFVSLTDLAPTFLQAAGLAVPKEMTGNSLLPLLKSEREGRVEAARDFMVFGRERHVPAQKMPSMDGYPARAIRTDRWLLILNFEPDRWPAGVSTGATHPIGRYADCDNGPTKSVVMGGAGGGGDLARFHGLCFGKRPASELYDCEADPDQVRNLAGDARHAGTVAALRERLVDYLRKTADPRFTGAPVKFDEYPYRGGYLKSRLKKHGH